MVREVADGLPHYYTFRHCHENLVAAGERPRLFPLCVGDLGKRFASFRYIAVESGKKRFGYFVGLFRSTRQVEFRMIERRRYPAGHP